LGIGFWERGSEVLGTGKTRLIWDGNIALLFLKTTFGGLLLQEKIGEMHFPLFFIFYRIDIQFFTKRVCSLKKRGKRA
jgi:hypothetical protein